MLFRQLVPSTKQTSELFTLNDVPEIVAFPVTFRLPVIFNQPSTMLSKISPKANVIFSPIVRLPAVVMLVSVIVVEAETMFGNRIIQ